MPGGLVTPGTYSGLGRQLSAGGEHTYEGKRFHHIINARLQLGKGDGDLVDPVQVQI